MPDSASARTSSSTRTWLPKSRLAVGSSSTTMRRVLRERARDQRELPLAAGDARVDASARCGDARAVASARARALASRAPTASRTGRQVRRASHQHDVAHREREIACVRLRHVAHAARDLPRATSDASRRRRARTAPPCAGSRPSSVLNSVVLPPPLGPSRHTTSPARDARSTRRGRPDGRDSRSEIARASSLSSASSARARIELPQEERRADERGQHAERDLDARRRCARACRRRAGTPAPSRIDIGQQAARTPGPTSMRAKCGITRPIQPMTPADRDRRRGHRASPRRSPRAGRGPVSTPSARASSSPSESRLMRQRSSHSGTRPTAISGSADATSTGVGAPRGCPAART